VPASNEWLVYLLRCADGTLYAGSTNDLARRLLRHGRGEVKYTRGRLPVTVAWSEPVAGGRGGALRRETQLKKLRRQAREALIATGLSRGPGVGIEEER
jgi:putative endonuclease